MRKKLKKLTPAGKVAMTFTGIGLALLCISLLVPFVWCLYASFKDVLDYALQPYAFPKSFHPENYLNVFSKLKITTLTKKGTVEFGLWDLVWHSAVYSISTPLIGVVFTTLMGYVMAKYSNKFSRFLYNFGIVLMILPIVGSMPSAMQLNKALGRYDNMLVWIITSPQGCFSGMAFLLFYQLFKGLPNAYGEAAEIDGAGHYAILFKIYLPMAFPLMAVQFTLSFLGAWNDYTTPMIWIPSYPTLAYGMYIFQYQAVTFHATQPEILAGFVIAMIPSFALYCSMQKLIVERMQFGGLKG